MSDEILMQLGSASSVSIYAPPYQATGERRLW
jgi:hypothetical protein